MYDKSRFLVLIIIAIMLSSNICAEKDWFVSAAIDNNAQRLITDDNKDFSSLISLGIGKKISSTTRLSLHSMFATREKYPGNGNSWGLGLRLHRQISQPWSNVSFFGGCNIMLLTINRQKVSTPTTGRPSSENNQSGVIGGELSIDEGSNLRRVRNYQLGLDLGLEYSISRRIQIQISSGLSFETDDVNYLKIVPDNSMELDVGEGSNDPVNTFNYKDNTFWSLRLGLSYYL